MLMVKLDSFVFFWAFIVGLFVMNLIVTLFLILFHYCIDYFFSWLSKKRGHELSRIYDRKFLAEFIYRSHFYLLFFSVLFFFVYWYLRIRDVGVFL